ncbi:UNVERIFIED_ORG: hypothetical protein L601_000600001870 [Gordonia westfalica J30]
MHAITVTDQGTQISYSIDDVTQYHGPGFPGGVAHAFKVLERALPQLGEPGSVERRDIVVATAHTGPGVRDTFEMVTRAVTENLPQAGDGGSAPGRAGRGGLRRGERLTPPPRRPTAYPCRRAPDSSSTYSG